MAISELRKVAQRELHQQLTAIHTLMKEVDAAAALGEHNKVGEPLLRCPSVSRVVLPASLPRVWALCAAVRPRARRSSFRTRRSWRSA